MSFGLFGKPAAPATTTPSFSFGGATATPQQPASTPAATGFGSFGQQQTNNTTATGTTGGLFGSTAQPAGQAQQPAAGGLFGSTAGANNTANTGSMFGAKPATPAGSLFGGGGATQQQQQQPAAGGLFGGGAAAQPAAASGGLFGSTPAQPATTGLFGAQSTSAPAAGGLFGGQSTSAPAAASTGGFFGAKPAAPTATTGFGGFGAQSTAQPATNSLFGQPAAQPAAGALNASTAAGPSNGMSKTTKFADLPENIQKVIENMDNVIKEQKQTGASINTENIGRAIWQTSSHVKAASDEQAAIAQGLESLSHSLQQLGKNVNAESADLQNLLETWEAAKPADARNSTIRPISHRDFPQEFFFRVAKSLEERVVRYKRTITMLSRALSSLAREQEGLSPQVVAQTIQNNQQSILSLAGQIERLQLRMNELRGQFVDDYHERTNSMRDPFEVEREAKGMSLLRA